MAELHMLPPIAKRILKHAETVKRRKAKAKKERISKAFIKAVASRDEKAIERVVARIHALRSADDDAA